MFLHNKDLSLEKSFHKNNTDL